MEARPLFGPLSTDRLLLRRYRKDEVQHIYGLVSNPLVMRYYPSVYGLDTAQRMLDNFLTSYEKPGYSLLAVERLSDQQYAVEQFRRLSREVVGRDAGDVRGWLLLARRHRRIIGRFGRFPHRNAILGREPTVKERVFLCYQRLRAPVVRLARRRWSQFREFIAPAGHVKY